jgi:predicted lipoprotein
MKKIFILFIALITILACSSSDDSGDTTGGSNYDRKLLLTNWADNIVIPSYVNYQAKIKVLATNITAFNTSPSEANLLTVRASWLEALIRIQQMLQVLIPIFQMEGTT